MPKTAAAAAAAASAVCYRKDGEPNGLHGLPNDSKGPLGLEAHRQEDGLHQHPHSAGSNADEDLLINLRDSQQQQLPAAASLFCWQVEPLMLQAAPSQDTQELSSVESCPGTEGRALLLSASGGIRGAPTWAGDLGPEPTDHAHLCMGFMPGLPSSGKPGYKAPLGLQARGKKLLMASMKLLRLLCFMLVPGRLRCCEAHCSKTQLHKL